MSIILAAMAPVMTTRMKADKESAALSSIWKWSTNGTDTYFGLNESQSVLIGEKDKSDVDNGKLIIQTKDDSNHILFRRDDNVLGRIVFGNNNRNILLGSGSFDANYTGTHDNVAIGTGVLNSSNKTSNADYDNKSSYRAINNVAIGSSALREGKGIIENNVAIGTEALRYGDNVQHSVAVGYNALGNGGHGRNVAVGAMALTMLTSYATDNGYDNVAIGNEALRNAHLGNNNIAIGSYANVDLNKDASMNNWGTIAIGTESVASHDYGIAIGNKASSTGDDTSWEGGISIGKESKSLNSISFGHLSVSELDGIAIGKSAYARGGYENISIGFHAGSAQENTGGNNIAIGSYACDNVTGSNKICIGSRGPNPLSSVAQDDTERIYIGGGSKFNNAPAMIEVHNTDESVKKSKFYNGMNSSGVVINGALFVRGPIFATARANVFANDSIWMASDNAKKPRVVALERQEWHDNGSATAAIKEDGGDYSIGYSNPDFLIPLFADTVAGHSSPTSDNAWGWKSSDRRMKYVGKEFTSGLDKIRQLKVFNYTFKKDPKKEPRVGVIAQDLQKIFPNAVKKAADGFLSIRMEDMFYAVINAIKELDIKVSRLEKENKLLKEQNKALEARLKALEAKVK